MLSSGHMAQSCGCLAGEDEPRNMVKTSRLTIGATRSVRSGAITKPGRCPRLTTRWVTRNATQRNDIYRSSWQDNRDGFRRCLTEEVTRKAVDMYWE